VLSRRAAAPVVTDPRRRAEARLAGELSSGDLDRSLLALTSAAVRAVPDVQGASITITHSDGRLETKAPTMPELMDVDAAQYALHEGPCYQAAVQGVHIVSTDLLTDERFPRYAEAAAGHGLHAQVGLSLFHRTSTRGALNLYSSRRGAFADLSTIEPFFAEQAALVLDYANEIGNLRQGLETRAIIGRAVGIVMERYQLTEERAFAFLTRLSQDRNVKLRDIAVEVAESVPASDAAPPSERRS
jgi:hypothetical protein